MSEEQRKLTDIKLEQELNLPKDFKPSSIDEWKEIVNKDLKGASFEKTLITKTYEDIDLQPLYSKRDTESLTFINNMPGFYNFVRGNKASGFVSKPWEINQELIYTNAKKFNEALKHGLDNGQTGITLTIDETTKAGLDSDNEKVSEAGKGGIPVSTLIDLSKALQGIDITKFPIHIDAGFSSLPFVIIFSAYLKKEGIEIKNLSGSIESDPVGFLVCKGKLPVTLEQVFNEMKTVLRWSIDNAPEIRTIGINGSIYHNSGASAVQELAFVLSTAVEYMNQMTDRGLTPDNISGNMRFTFGIGSFYFMEVSRLRAARMLWAKILNEYKVSNGSKKMIIHSRTSSYNQTKFDPYVNILRTTTEAFSAIASGTDSLHTNNLDETFNISNEFSSRIARNTQTILHNESHLNRVIDPGGGSYYIEKLTEEVAKKSWTLFQEIEKQGGIIRALEKGYPQELISETASKKKKDVSRRKAIIIGTNMHANKKEEKHEANLPDYKDIYKKRVDFFKEFSNYASKKKYTTFLNKLQSLVSSESNDIINIGADAVLQGATIGNISETLRTNSVESIKVNTISPHRASKVFEDIRNTSEKYKKETSNRPKVFLINRGTLKQYKARADFSRDFFEVGGFDVLYLEGSKSNEEAVSSAINSKAPVVVICSTDDTYTDIVPSIVKGVKEKNKNIAVVLAGNPKDRRKFYEDSGIDEFIYIGVNIQQVLENLLRKIGVMA
ncbi:MAG: acyl-CoA mutase large subunit family protein [Ignavibacteria bacterium]|nr:acyl-CoA mutase large subunit family protein [Ignavibacteria bacterium]